MAPLHWVQQLKDLNATTQASEQFLSQRSKAATAVAQTISHTLDIDRKQKTPALYAVWIHGHQQPIYVGQTLDVGRRLWDLPIGESHHLANSFPVEIWKAVMVLRWHDLLSHHLPQDLEQRLMRLSATVKKPLKTLGEALEYQLQLHYRPLFNMRKRKRDGSLRTVKPEKSKSAGALTAPHLGEIWTLIHKIWIQCENAGLEQKQSQVLPFGGMVFWDETGDR